MAAKPLDEQAIFEAARKIQAGDAREAYLQQACGDNPAIEKRVRALLKAYEEDASFLESPVIDRPSCLDREPLAETRGEVPAGAQGGASTLPPFAEENQGLILAGRYKLLERVGEGGMGSVWMAQQTEPVKRLVAVKLIKPGMDSKQVLVRFEAERQALALMDHPNIAKVHDAGTTSEPRPLGSGEPQPLPYGRGSDRPFFVMELVKGVPITKYCDEHHLTPRQRLELFLPVCHAIQHAHQKGIIHRDIKPSNILVALYDDRPVPKVIDFGVAKATGQQLTEQTLHTGFGAVVGTLEYMSPEQASFNQLDVDTRSDIYSLGVLLYELLAGSTPFSRKELEKAGVMEMLRVIREQEPARPSTKLSTAEGLPTLAANRGTEPAKLTRLMRGELDWIVMKALEKDRNRRYETANGFAMDVQRYLADEPVQACPPSAGYRFRKFARRNKTTLAMASVLTLAVLLVVGSLGWMAWNRAIRQEQVAGELAARRLVVDQFLKESDRHLQATNWQLSLVEARRAEAALAAGPVDEFLKDRVAERLKDLELVRDLEELGNGGWDPDRKGDTTYATLFRQYGIDVEALPAEEVGARIRERAIRNFLVGALDYWAMEGRRYWSGPADNGKQEGKQYRLKRHLLAITRVADPDEFRNRIRDALAQNDGATLRKLADSVRSAELSPVAATLLAKALFSVGERDGAVMILRQVQPRYPDDLELTSALASYLWKDPKTLTDGIRYYQAALALRPRSLGLSANLAMALENAGRKDEALFIRQRTAELHPRNPYAQSNLGTSLLGVGKLPEAVAAFKETLRLKSDMDAAHHNLGITYARQGKIEPAIVCFRRTIELNTRHAEAHAALGAALVHLGKFEDAEAHCRRAIEFKPKYANAHFNLGNALAGQGKTLEAIACYRQAIQLDPKHVHALNSLAWNLATCADRNLRNPLEAVKLAEASTRLMPQNGGHWNTLGVARYRAGDSEAAVAALIRSMELGKGGTAFDWFFLAMAHQQMGKKEDARQWYNRAVPWMEKHAPKNEELRRFRAEAEEVLAIKKDSK